MTNNDLIAAVGGINKARKIVDRAPCDAEYFAPLSLFWGYCKDLQDNTHHYEVADGYTKEFSCFRDGGWWPSVCEPKYVESLVCLTALRAAVAAYTEDETVGEHEPK